MVLPLFVFLKHSASQTGYQGGGHESRLPANEGYVFTLCALLFLLPQARGPLLKRSAPRRVTMPAIASLEDLKVAQRDGRSKFLIVTPCALRFTPDGF